MVDFRFPYGKDDSAVEDLISQAKDLYVLEQVAKINCSGFTDDSALPSNLETRFRRLKSLPVSSSSKKLVSHSKSMASYSEKKNRKNVSSVSNFSALPTNLETRFRRLKTLSVLSSSKKLVSHSKSMASYSEKRNRKNVSSVSDFSNFSRNLTGKSYLLDSSVGIKRNPSVKSGFEKKTKGSFGLETSGDLSNSGRIGSSSSSFSREGKVFTPTTRQTLKPVPKEKSRISSSSLNSFDLDLWFDKLLERREEGKKQKLKSKLKVLISWFDKFPLAQVIGCVPHKSSSNSKKIKESCKKNCRGKKNSKR